MKPVLSFFAVTVAPGTAAFCSSSTRPVIVPVVCWADAAVVMPMRQQRRDAAAAMS